MLEFLTIVYDIQFGRRIHSPVWGFYAHSIEIVCRMSEFKTIAKTGAVAEGTGAAFPLEGRMIAIFNEEGKYYAIDDFCPHMGASLAAGHVEDGTVLCPWHAWRFNICDGTWCDNPKLSVAAYEVRVVGDEIQVKIEENESNPENQPN